MNKKEVSGAIKDKCLSFMLFMHELSETDYQMHKEGEWSASQYFEHVVLSLKPLTQILEMNALAIANVFGTTSRKNYSYEDIASVYLGKLSENDTLVNLWIPQSKFSKEQLLYQLNELSGLLQYQINSFDDNELEILLTTHPLLETITLKEMIYSALFYVDYIQKKIENNIVF